MAEQHGSYIVRDWVAYQSRDPLRAVSGKPGVDAAIIETPYERVRYEAYLHRLQGDRITASTIETLRATAQNTVGVLIYAHSRNDEDRGFLDAMMPATLALADGTVERPVETVRFGPSDDFYDVGAFREERWTGSITYRFARPRCAGREVIRFKDGRGNAYRFTFDPARFR